MRVCLVVFVVVLALILHSEGASDRRRRTFERRRAKAARLRIQLTQLISPSGFNAVKYLAQHWINPKMKFELSRMRWWQSPRSFLSRLPNCKQC